MGQRHSCRRLDAALPAKNSTARGGGGSKRLPPSTCKSVGVTLEDKREKNSESGDHSTATQETKPARELPHISESVTRIHASDVTCTQKIANGAFTLVWLAHLSGGNLVAVKKLYTWKNNWVPKVAFVAELNLLSTLNHPRILGLIGACYDDALSDVQIVMEFMDSGDLLTVLRKHPPTELTWENGKGTFCVQICEAVYYLHSLSKPLIHRDIKSRNILMDSHKGAKLSDFGEICRPELGRTRVCGFRSMRWTAPEILLGGDFGEQADIYSLGVVLTELDTHRVPYKDLGLEEWIIYQVAFRKLRPTVSDSCPDVIRHLVYECLQWDPHLRPSAAYVLETLKASALARDPTTPFTLEVEGVAVENTP